MLNVFVYAAAIATIILVPSTYLILSKKGLPSSITGICNNDACKRAAKRLSSAINPDVEPCNNFYQFACGNYGKLSSKYHRGTYSYEISIDVEDQLKSVITEKSTKKDPEIFKTMNNFFQLCMDQSNIDNRGAAPGLEYLSKVGGWPVLDNWSPGNWDLVQTMIRFWQMGYIEGSLIGMLITTDATDNNRYIFQVNPPSPMIPRENFLNGENDPIVEAYFEFMVDIAVLFSADSGKAEKHMKEVLNFQIQLAEILTPGKERQRNLNESYKVFTIQELQDKPGNWINWNVLLEGVMSPLKPLQDQRIAVIDLEVVNNVGKLIQRFPSEVIADHVMWTAAVSIAKFLSSTIRRRVERFTATVTETPSTSDRLATCITAVKDNFDLALSSIYVKKFSKKSTQKIAKEMSSRIQKEMERELQEVEWMDTATREKAQLKAANILHVIGYTEEITNKNMVDGYYKELNMVKDSYFESIIEIGCWILKQDVRLLTQTVGKRHWTNFGNSFTVNNYYHQSNNAIDIAAGSLQEPLISPSVPYYLNYANLGVFIGHELTHAFDEQGRQYGPEGNLEDWWDDSSLQKFNEMKQCLINQYSSFKESETGIYVDGDLTQGENIADIGGWKLTYRAYQRLAAQLKKPEPGLPGLQKYTIDQLFLLSSANKWCSDYPREVIKHRLLTDTHSPPEWRVNGVFINMPEFGDIFKCDKGTPMNPEKKCKVW